MMLLTHSSTRASRKAFGTVQRAVAQAAAKQRRSYNVAITRTVPDTFANALSSQQHHDTDNVDVIKAQDQHEAYVKTLREHIPVWTMPAMDDLPDSCFIEDVAFMLQNRAVLTRTGHPSRRDEVFTVQVALENLGVETLNMLALLPDGMLDGGDILCTGRHIYVGLSDRTNEKGVAFIREVYDDILPVFQIPPLHTMFEKGKGKQENSFSHLKSVVTKVNEGILVAHESSLPKKVIELFEMEDYEIHFVPDPHTCNVVELDRVVIVQETSCTKSRKILETAAANAGKDLVFCNPISELVKKDGTLTSTTLLLDL